MFDVEFIFEKRYGRHTYFFGDQRSDQGQHDHVLILNTKESLCLVTQQVHQANIFKQH